MTPLFSTPFQHAIANSGPLIIFGGGDIGRQVIALLQSQPGIEIAGIVDPNLEPGSLCMDLPVLGSESVLALPDYLHLKAGIVTIGDPALKKVVVNTLKSLRPDMKFPPVIDPSALIQDNVQIGEGCLIMAGSLIQNNGRIGAFTLMGSGCLLEHDAQIEPYCTLGPGTRAAGHFHLGEGSTTGIGTIVIQGIEIGKNSLIGAGSLVLKSVADNTTAYGHPLHTFKQRNSG